MMARGSVGSSWTASELVEKVEAGALCKGIYLTDDLDEVLIEREPVIKVKQSLEFKGAKSVQQTLQKVFKSEQQANVFEGNIDKCSKADVSPDTSTVWNLSLQSDSRKKDKTSHHDDGYVAAITCELVPVAAVNLTLNDLELQPEVIAAFQNIEKSVKPHYKPAGHFREFFQRFGSHFTCGPIDFGGILLSRASCQNFPEANRFVKTKQAIQASQLALTELFEEQQHTPAHSPIISVVTKKIGGHPDDESNAKKRTKLEWKETLKEISQCRVIDRSSEPQPIWVLLKQQAEHFEKALALAKVMEEEWKNHGNPEMQERYRRLEQLRNDLQRWLEKWKNVHEDKDKILLFKELAVLRHAHSVPDEDWQDEILYKPEVQEVLKGSSSLMDNTADLLEKYQLSTWTKRIFDPLDKVEVQYFPEADTIISHLKDVNSLKIQIPFEMTALTDLPSILHDQLEEIFLEEEAMYRSLQDRLETTIKHWSEKQEAKYEYLLCLSVLQQKGLSGEGFSFSFPLVEEDFQHIIDSLQEHFYMFSTIRSKSKKQAYLLYVTMENKHGSQKALDHMIEAIPDLFSEVQQVLDESKREDLTLDEDRFRKSISQYLKGHISSINTESLLESLKSQVVSENQELSLKRTAVPEECAAEKSLEEFLAAVEMAKFYPQKLTYDEVITLTSDMMNDAAKKPTSLPELPWFFLRQIIALDSTTRENSHIAGEEVHSDDSSDSDSDSDESGTDDDEVPSVAAAVHILDLIYVIFLCADDFLRQELVDKMAKCQYAVPFILPPPNGSKSLVFEWGLKSLSRVFYDGNKVVQKTLTDAEAPIISCLTFGEETSWKSKFLNILTCPQQEMFWHQALAGGNCKQRFSEGMVEVGWYLPGGHKDDFFSSPVTFLNSRGDAQNSAAVSKALLDFSSVSCVFVEQISEELKAFLRNSTTLQNTILVVHHRKGDEVSMKTKCKELRKMLNLEKYQVIQKSSEEAKFYTVCESLKKGLKKILLNKKEEKTLTALVDQIRGKPDFLLDVELCSLGYGAAQEILKEIDELNIKKTGSAKREILPYHSDIGVRREIAALDKELCRQRKRTENTRLQDYAQEVKSKKQRLQLNQLHIPISETFKYFLSCLFQLEQSDRKYFLQSLKIGLNERSKEMLQPLYEQYEKARLEEESEEKEENLRELDEQITQGSLGLEHFFREMAVMYENMAALKEKSKRETLDEFLDEMSSIMAEILMEGTALEIMDGDTVDVPVSWLTAVLSKISTRARLFKVSVLGAQSCGKSTILNTAFGLNFPVSSGRCTRGAYIQLVKVEESLRETHKCDYILVIDSEGLMSRLRSSSSDFDNELATFIIGLSDLTLVIIKGEGSEMQDVLPLAIHVFLRMNIVGEHQACHFVHQNMGAVGAMQAVAIEIDAFVRDLNAKTLAAAKDADQSDHYTKFTDVLKYEKTKDNTYVPGLWDGSLPMAKTKTHYSHTIQKLKSDILQHIERLNTQKAFGTFDDLVARIHELWEAIKFENFLFSFQNVLAVEAYTQLNKVYDEEQWKVKRDVREMIQNEQYKIENEWRSTETERTLTDLINDSKMHITNNHIMTGLGVAEKKILHYFQCPGCDSCRDKVKNRHYLAKYEQEFKDELYSLQKKLIKELDNQMETLEVKIRADTRILQLNTEMDDILKSKVNEAIEQGKYHNKDDESFKDILAQLQRETSGDILRMARFVEDKVDIKAVVQDTITKLLKKDGQFYLHKIDADGRKRRQGMRNSHKAARISFRVSAKEHLKLKSFLQRTKNFFHMMYAEQHAQRLQDYSDSIIELTRKYYDARTCPGGRKFDRKEGEMLFQEVIKKIGEIEDKLFKTTNEYRMDLLLHIENLAVPAFSEMHERYCKESSPGALLKKKMKIYNDLFMVRMGEANAAAKFCQNVLQDMILQNIEDQLSCTELLNDLRVHCGETFRDIKSLQASIMVDLYRDNFSEKYIKYINKYEVVMKQKIMEKSLRYFEVSGRFKIMALTKLDVIMGSVQVAVDKTCSTAGDGKDFIKRFFSNIRNLRISHTEYAAFLDLDVPDKRQFGAIVYQELQGQIKKSIKDTIYSWTVKQKLEERNLVEFLFTEIVGCSARCPFCQVPCDAHTGGKTSGKHSSTMHRPAGLGGNYWIRTDRLLVEDCRIHVASQNVYFLHGKKRELWTKYRDYRKVYPDWTIHGDADPDAEKYWKWVFTRHNEAFAEYYSRNKALLPATWSKYTKQEIKKDIENHYRVKVKL